MKKYADSTLMRLDKKTLLEHLRTAEHNREVAEQTLAQQAENLKDWRPVRHGRWTNMVIAIAVTTGDCSVCRKEAVWRTRKAAYPICPNCGARMDLKDGAENG